MTIFIILFLEPVRKISEFMYFRKVLLRIELKILKIRWKFKIPML